MANIAPLPFSPGDVEMRLERLCRRLGEAIRAARQTHGWTVLEVAMAASLSRSAVARLESGLPGSLATYSRVADVLDLRLTWELAALATTLEAEDAVHAVMGEVQATRFGKGRREVLIDEPYQHFRFGGRADLVVVDRRALALEHSENKTRIVNVGDLSGSYNAKCLWLPRHVAERLGVRRFTSESHNLVLLWSEEVLTVVRSLPTTLRSLGPDGTKPFEAWWNGAPRPGVLRGLVVFDPIDRGTSRPRWVSLAEALESRPRYRGYLDAYQELQAAGLT